ncbi:MAG: hypothetical protein JKY67_00480 [Pseudomonadales bacterium]|nr:hypothetical protein [Pseudomonadales bacterium]
MSEARFLTIAQLKVYEPTFYGSGKERFQVTDKDSGEIIYYQKRQDDDFYEPQYNL